MLWTLVAYIYTYKQIFGGDIIIVCNDHCPNHTFYEMHFTLNYVAVINFANWWKCFKCISCSNQNQGKFEFGFKMPGCVRCPSAFLWGSCVPTKQSPLRCTGTLTQQLSKRCSHSFIQCFLSYTMIWTIYI